MASNMLWFENNGVRSDQIDMKDARIAMKMLVLFWRSLILKYFSGMFGRIQAKFFRTHKNLPTPTPMVLKFIKLERKKLLHFEKYLFAHNNLS